MNNTLRKRAVNFLNKMDVLEENGGESAYILVENNKENQMLLQEAGIPLETALKYGDEETFCILSLAFGEGYCDFYDGSELIVFDKQIEFDLGDGNYVAICKYGDNHRLTLNKESGGVHIKELTDVLLNGIQSVIA